MPNHVTNRIEVDDPRVIRALLNERDEVDFNRLTPMPKEVENTTVGSSGFDPQDERGWYGWSLAHWGTKWNAYDTDLDGDNLWVRFDTAWSHPSPIIEALSRLFPEAELRVEFADENFGCNVGRYTMRNGQPAKVELPVDSSPEALELASQIQYGLGLMEAKEQGYYEDYKEEEEG